MQRYAETVRSFRGRFHSRYVQSIHNLAQNEENCLVSREIEREMCPWAISKYFGD
jgi:hypothetical protein